MTTISLSRTPDELQTPADGLSTEQVKEALAAFVADDSSGRVLRRVLLIPPDATRRGSYAGLLTKLMFELLSPQCHVDILPALGTHTPMTEAEWNEMFEGVPFSCVHHHNWRDQVATVGVIPADFVEQVSEGWFTQAIPVSLNKLLLQTGAQGYDLIMSLGQVVPHEVAGMANYTKNVVIGCGGKEMIDRSHMVGALVGIEQVMGRGDTAVRRLFDYAEQHFLADLPLAYGLTVVTQRENEQVLSGLFLGQERTVFEQAVSCSQSLNITYLDKAYDKVVASLTPAYKTTWLGNKAIYRTRMAIADGGELVVLAPAVDRFGEDEGNDELIRMFGYVGRENVLAWLRTEPLLQENLSVAAHLIHGSSDQRFQITYASPHLSREEVELAGFQYMAYDEATRRYPVKGTQTGEQTMPSGEEVYYVAQPGAGLWTTRARFEANTAR